jgi:hypothetical protein
MTKSIFRIMINDAKTGNPETVFCVCKEHEQSEPITHVKQKVQSFVFKLLEIKTHLYCVDYIGPFVEPLKSGNVASQSKHIFSQL